MTTKTRRRTPNVKLGRPPQPYLSKEDLAPFIADLEEATGVQLADIPTTNGSIRRVWVFGLFHIAGAPVGQVSDLVGYTNRNGVYAAMPWVTPKIASGERKAPKGYRRCAQELLRRKEAAP